MPYLSPPGRAPALAPAPAPASSPLGASCRGLGPASWAPTFCPGSGAAGRTDARCRRCRSAGTALALRRRAAPPTACSPGARARRLSYRRSHPPGEGSWSLNSSPPTGRRSLLSPAPSPPAPAAGPGVGFGQFAPAPSPDPPSEGASEAGWAPRRSAAHLLPRRGGGSSWAGGLSHDGGGGRGRRGGEGRDPAVRARLRTARGWGDSQRRAQKGTKMKPTGQPSGVRKRSRSLQPLSAVWCLPRPPAPAPTPATDFTSSLPVPPQP